MSDLLKALRPSISIGSVDNLTPAVLAPMSGVSDLAFRRIAAQYGAGWVVSEMVASRELLNASEEARLRMEGAGLSPHVVQLAGREPEWIAEAARHAAAAGADIIDINMGCPAKRVTTGYSGAALMRDLDLAERLIVATLEAVDLPVTVKMRLGWDAQSLNAGELARRAARAGVAAITVHGRTRAQFYKGRADWRAIRDVRDCVDLPVIANGDLETVDQVAAMLAQSGADGVMVGRGAYGRPWIVGQVADALLGRPIRPAPQGATYWDMVLGHYEAMLQLYGREMGMRTARKHLAWYFDTLASDVLTGDERRAMLTADTPATVFSHLRALAQRCDGPVEQDRSGNPMDIAA